LEALLSLADLTGEKHARAVLGVERDADLSAVKKAYRALVLENHPDKQVGASPEELAAKQEKFQEVQQAYETLTQLLREKKAEEEAEAEGGRAASRRARRRADRTEL